MTAKLWGWLGALVWAIAAGVLASQLTIPSSVVCAVVAVGAGIYLGPRAAASRVRMSSWWVGLFITWLLVVWFSVSLRNGELGPHLLGPMVAFTVSECCRWLLLPFSLVLVLRVSSLRVRSFLVVEVAAVAWVLAGIFAGHREGFINRPYFFVDPLWAQGYDPLPAFLAVGAAVAALVVILIATQRSERRTVVDLVVLIGIIVAIFVFLPTEQLKNIPQIRQQLENKLGKNEKRPERKDDDAKGSGTPMPGQESQPKEGQGKDGQTRKDWDKLVFDNQPKPNGSNAPVAVVLLHSDHNPPSGLYYFRETAFSQFNGQKLVKDTTGLADLDQAYDFPVGTLDLPHPATEVGTNQELDTTVAMLTQHNKPFGLVDATQYTAAANPDPRRFQRAYDVKSQVLTKGLLQLLRYDVGDPAWADPAPPSVDPSASPRPLSVLQQHYIESPRDAKSVIAPDPRYRQLLDTIFKQLRPSLRDNKVAQAYAIKLWLENNGTYSLTSKYENSADPVGDFLFGDKTGYCVFFAHSAVYLMRMAGIPARVGAGYAVNARNRGSGSALLIRERDSHAWPEVYVQNVGWVVVDIRPKKSIVPPEDPPDAGQQQMLGDMARKNANKQDDHRLGKGDLQELLRQLLLILWHSLLPALAIFIACMYATKVYRRVRPYYCTDRELPILALQAALDGLADVGRVRRFGQTREDFARSQGPILEELTSTHLKVTLGGQNPPLERPHLIALYRQAVSGAVRHTRWYRCLFGWLNPFSWWRVK